MVRVTFCSLGHVTFYSFSDVILIKKNVSQKGDSNKKKVSQKGEVTVRI